MWLWTKQRQISDSVINALEAQTKSQERSLDALASAIKIGTTNDNIAPLRSGPTPASGWALAIATIVLAIANVGVLFWQTGKLEDQSEAAHQQVELAREQFESATGVQLAQARIADSEFLSRVEIAADSRGVSVTNRAPAAIGASGLWLKESFGAGGHLQEFEGTLDGVPTCATLRIPRTVLLDSVEPGRNSKLGDFVRRPPLAVEAQLVLQGPSGVWFMVSDDGLFEELDAPEDRKDLDQDSELALRVLRFSARYQGSVDGYWEGFSTVATGSIRYAINAGETVSGYGPRGLLHSASC